MPTRPGDYAQQPAFPKPGPVVLTLMCVIGGLWLAFAVGIHWAGVQEDVFLLFCGNTLALLHGQLWRLLTAPLLSMPTGFWHVFGVLLSLYFFATALEEKWSRGRFVRFLLALAIVPAVAQLVVDLALPVSVSRTLSEPYWFGGLAIASGVTVAWALNFRGGVVRLYGILPISPRVLILFVVASPLGFLIFREPPAEGTAGLLAGCLTGWLLGGGTPSPLRRYWLNFRVGRLDAEVQREAAQRKRRVERSQLKVIEGGRGKPEEGGDAGGRGPDGRWLN
jgi:membrane associated rhomboid family serine protease